MSKNPVVHFEMGYFDGERAKKFYEAAFGWKMKPLGPATGDYILAQTADTDATGLVESPGMINGGLYQKTESPHSHLPSVVVSVPDISEAIKAVEAAGGKILGSLYEDREPNKGPQLIPGVGLWITFMDTENNRLSLLQPTEM